jgi:hypothetical protein
MGTVLGLRTQSLPSRGRWSGYLNHGTSHFFMSALGRFSTVRSGMVWLHSQSRPSVAPAAQAAATLSNATMIDRVDVEEAVRGIQRDGFYPGLRLRREVLAEFLSFCSEATCFGEGKPEYTFRYGDRRAAEQRAARSFRRGFYNNALRSSHLLQSLLSDAQLVRIAGGYLGTDPVPIQARIWWSFCCPPDGEKERLAGQGFHYDIDSYRGLTFFFYLTDVGPSNGAHVFVRGTHKQKLWKDSFCIYKRRSDAEIEESYGADRQVCFCGRAGYGFAEDIFGFHKGLPPVSGDRLMIQLGYGLRDYWNFQNQR